MSENGEHADVVVLDPPRSGSTEAFVKAAASIAPKRIIYISCNPETLGRDLEWFQKAGYRAVRAEGVDMFAFTNHVETVVLIQRKGT